jgi:HD-GYP domain-containing protein (c-di-GMP phosphodiesterase class II)
VSSQLVLLVEASEGRRAELVGAIEEAHFRCISIADPSAASAAALVSLDVVAVSLLDGLASPHALLSAWRDEPRRAAIPLLGIVPAGRGLEAETALTSGADDVLEWPAAVPRLAARLRSLAGRSLLKRESGDFTRALGSILGGFEAREVHRVDHSLRVSGLALELGRLASLSADELDRLRQGSVFYDIGTVSIPDRILLKEAEFTAEELALVRSHPVVGFEMIRGIRSFEPLAPFVLRHHERIDGSGYPYGLKGRDVLLGVQILGMSDAYDALVSSRPHRPPRQHGEAMSILREEARSGHWDTSLIALLEEAVPASGVHGEVARGGEAESRA